METRGKKSSVSTTGQTIPLAQSLVNAPLGRLDAVLAAAHMIPRQTDLAGLLRMVKYSSHHLLKFQLLALLLETPLQERDRLTSFEVATNQAASQHLELKPTQNKYEMFLKLEPRFLTEENLSKEFPAAAQLELFKNFTQCLWLPLAIEVNGYHAALAIIWTQDLPILDDLLPLCRVLAGVVAAQLTQILRTEEHNLEIETLRKEREQLTILVNLANVANSTLRLDSLLDMLALDLCHFFAVKNVALCLEENDKLATIYGAKVGVASVEPPRGQHLPLEHSLLRFFQGEAQARLLSPKELKQIKAHDPLASFWLAKNFEAVYGLPLFFQGQKLGVLALANTNAEVFTDEATKLLSQIALTVGSAVHNAREYELIDSTRRHLEEENAYLSSEVAKKNEDPLILGQSEAIRKVLQQIAMVAASDSTVLILGETGTGKELVAQAVHRGSPRKAHPMIKLNCAAVPSGLLESELFGHEKGAFTGALRQRKGRFEMAQGSTLFLDEIGDLPLELQPKLLRILQARELERLGGNTVIPIDVRLVAATNQNLLAMVQDKRFREDLYYRLHVFPIHLPPLRERREDIPLLAYHFMAVMSQKMKKEITRIAPQDLRWLCNHDWPGNVRELENVIERAVILSSGNILHLPKDAWSEPTASPNLEPWREKAKPAKEQALAKESGDLREEIIAAILACNGLIAGPRGAAQRLGVNRTTLNSRLKRLGINVKDILEQARHKE